MQKLKWPLELASDGQLATVELDSDEEVGQCLAVILRYAPGDRRRSLSFGVPEQLFRDDGPDLTEVRAALQANEPRARYDVELTDDRLLGAIADMQVGFDAGGAS